jgi:ABC-2 type transport system permease protein
MSLATYARYELTRTFRNRRFVIFSFGFPLALYFAVAGPNRHELDLGGSGISAPVYFMTSLAAFGAMNATLAVGARIAAERSVGWNRQLRITPLTTRDYFRTKVLTGYAAACATILVMYVAGATLGVSLPARNLIEMTGLILVGLVPFAAGAIAMGHLVSVDSIGPAMGGTTAVLAFLGGTWFPITGDGVFATVAKCLPSYWLVQAGHVGLGGSAWGRTGWLVVAAWTVALTALAARAYRRDTGRF